MGQKTKIAKHLSRNEKVATKTDKNCNNYYMFASLASLVSQPLLFSIIPKTIFSGKVIFLNSAGNVCGNFQRASFQHHCHGQHATATFPSSLLLESFNRDFLAHYQGTLHGMSLS